MSSYLLKGISLRFSCRNLAIFTLTLLALAVVLPGSARAQVSIAVVDIDRLLSETRAAKSIRKQVTAQQEAFDKQMQALEKQLIESLNKLKKEAQNPDSKKEDLEKKKHEFETKRFEAKKTLKRKMNALNKGASEAMNRLSDGIFSVCAQIAKEKKYDLIITRNNVIIGAKSLDITDEVMKRLNKDLPEVKVSIKK